MSGKILFVAVFSVLFGGIASADLLVKDGQKVAFLGDSITAQGWELPGGYVKLTVAGLETLGVKVVPIPAGVGGNTSRDMVARFTQDVLDKKPDWLTLSCGVNDVWHGAGGCTLDEYEKNITSMVDQAQAAGIKVLIMTSTVIGEDDNGNNKKLVAYNDFLHQLAAGRHLPVAEENAAFQDALKADAGLPGPVITQDGVHPNSDGSVVMARALLAGFGASPAQIDQAQAAWMDMPASAFVHVDFGLNLNTPLTLGQYQALKAAAATRKTSLRPWLQALLLQTLDETIQAHHDDPVLDAGKIQQETQQAFAAKVAALSK
jgi:lysophospholipase L1-like esterase